MARFQGEEFMVGDHLDAVLQAIDEDFFQLDAVLSSELDTNITEMPVEAAIKSFPCPFCTKVCVSQPGLTRHMNTKHKEHKQ